MQYTSYSFANRNSTIDTVPWSYITALIGNFIPFAMAPWYFGIGITTNLNISCTCTEKCFEMEKKMNKGSNVDYMAIYGITGINVDFGFSF